MNGKIRIRVANREDVPSIFRLVEKLAEYEKLTHQVTGTEADFLRFGFENQPYFHALMAEWVQESQVQTVGFALYFFTFSTFLARPTLYLEDLFVLPEFRGRGVGTALLKELAGIALKHECGRMEWAVLDWNEPAIRFYRSIGARPLREWTTFRLDGEALQQFARGK